jgi:hypothetical protein
MYRYSLVPGKHLNTFASAKAVASTTPTIFPSPPSGESGTATKQANLLNKNENEILELALI